MTNISATIETGNGNKENLSYNSIANTLTNIDSTSNKVDTVIYKFITETWALNADGSYAINESYINPNLSANPINSTDNGTWEYESNTKTDNAFYLSGSHMFLIEELIQFTGFNIQSVSNSTLILSFNTSSVSNIISNNPGYTTNYNGTITFTRQ